MNVKDDGLMASASLVDISKSFVRDQPVLRDVSFDVLQGEIHGLAGANGSGKSTLVKIMSGYHRPDAGEFIVGGRRLPVPIRPQQVRAAGVRFVHQEKGFVAGMSVLDNMCLGRGYTVGLGGRIKWKQEARALERELERHNVKVSLAADAGELSIGTRAKLAIIRALYKTAGEERQLIVLDEPTAAMAGDEALALGHWLRETAQRESLGVLFICHRIEELLEVSDRVSVLRGGAIVATFRSSSATTDEVVEALVGTSAGALYPAAPGTTGSEKSLEVTNLTGRSVRGVTFSVSRGEVVGLTGVQGSGFEEVPYLLFDSEQVVEGTATFGGTEIDLRKSTIARHLKRGVAMVPADRAKNSIVADLTVRENVTQPRLHKFWRMGLLRKSAERRDAAEIVRRLRIVPSGTETKASSLSGGNQQKVVVGKWLALTPKVLLLHEPTEGVDVMAKREIFRIIAEQARNGTTCVIASLEYEDLVHICDRILVFGNGQIFTEVPGHVRSAEDVMRAAYTASLGAAGASGTQARWPG